MGGVASARVGDGSAAASSAPADPATAVAECSGLAELYSRHYLGFVRYAYLLCHSSGDAEDLVQDAFVRLQRARGLPTQPEALKAYTYVTITNLTRGYRRRYRAHRSLAEAQAELDRAGRDAHDPAGMAAARLDVHRAIHDLPERQRQVVVLRYWADLSEQQIADHLGISVGTVKKAAARATATLEARLGTRRI